MCLVENKFNLSCHFKWLPVFQWTNEEMTEILK